MGCRVSEKPDSLPAAQSPSSSVTASERFKIPKKSFFNDCNDVYHAYVPRKLRSAMKKRSRESMLPDSEKVNHEMKNGIESPIKESVKKSRKQGSPNWPPREGVSGPITKDEEEVAETLYALAGMFPDIDNGSNNRRELDGESLPEKSSVLQDLKEKANAAFEVSGTAQDSCPCPERSPREAAKISSSNETIDQEQPNLAESAKFLTASHSSTPKITLQTMPVMRVRSENSNKVPLLDSELCLTMGLNMPRQSQISHFERKSDKEFETARGVDWKQEQHTIKEQKENEGPALWPGLSLAASAGIQASHSHFSANEAPDWLDTAFGASKQDLMESCSSGGQISEVVSHRRSWKRCAAHVHISHLIRSLEVSKIQVVKEPELYESHKMRPHEGSKRGVLMEVHTLNGMRNGVTPPPGTVYSVTARNPHETKNGILQQQCHYPTPGVYAPQKQSCNFLSLSAGSNGLKIDNSYDKVASRLEPLSKLRVPYFQSLAQQHGLMPIPTTQSHYASSSYLDQLSVAGPQVRLQQPHYYSSPLCGSHYGSTGSNKQQHHQSFWAVQLAAEGRSAVNCNIMKTQYPNNWQSGRHDSSAVSPGAQAMVPRSHASLEVLRSKVTSISEQQQLQLIGLTSSLPSSKTNELDLHFPSVCNERGRFHSSGTSSLQLLCDERI